MMKRIVCIFLIVTALCGVLASCNTEKSPSGNGTNPPDSNIPNVPNTPSNPPSGSDSTEPIIPDELKEIQSEYFSAADEQGRLVELHYDTWESTTYAEKTKKLTKRAIVYLPYGYDENKEYNTFYYMHGGWGNETTQMGTPERPSGFKNVIDYEFRPARSSR